MFHVSFVGRFCETPARAAADALQFLRDLLELVALDDVADLILVEIPELDPALQAGAHFLHVVLEAAQRRSAAVVNRLPLPHDAGPRGAGDTTIGDQTASDDSFA